MTSNRIRNLVEEAKLFLRESLVKPSLVQVLACFASFAASFVTEGFILSIPATYPLFPTYFDCTPTQASVLGSIVTGSWFVYAPLSGILMTKLGNRATLWIGGLLMTCGLLIATFAPNYWTFLFGFSIITGMGLGIAYLPAITTAASYVSHAYKHPMAAANLVAGACGALVFSFVATAILQQQGFRWTFFTYAMIEAQLFVLGAMVMTPALLRKPDRIGSIKRQNSGTGSNNPKRSGTMPTEVNEAQSAVDGGKMENRKKSVMFLELVVDDATEYRANQKRNDQQGPIGKVPDNDANAVDAETHQNDIPYMEVLENSVEYRGYRLGEVSEECSGTQSENGSATASEALTAEKPELGRRMSRGMELLRRDTSEKYIRRRNSNSHSHWRYNLRLTLLCLSHACWNFADFGFFYLLPNYLYFSGKSDTDVGNAFVILNSSTVFGRIITVFMVMIPGLKKARYFAGVTILCGIAQLLQNLQSIDILVPTTLYGVAFGLKIACVTNVPLELFGPQRAPHALSYAMFAQGVTGLASQFTFGFLLGDGWSYKLCFTFAGILEILAAMILAPATIKF